ncbi:MAG TPA: CHASE3 domain-containing protein [Polyangia bacterium]|nr:CHASE3 domain-containing protein [Polyangia bacterium]
MTLPSTSKINFVFTLGLLLVGVSGAITYIDDRRVIDFSSELTRSMQTLGEIKTVRSLVQDAETGQRGYLLTGDVAYRVPYDNAMRELEPTLEHLSQALASHRGQASRMAELRSLIAQRLSIIRETVHLKEQGEDDAAVRIVRGGQGKRIMDQIREVLSKMEAQEADGLQARIRNTHQAASDTTLVTLGASGLAFLAVLLATIVVNLHIRRQRLTAEELEAAREEALRASQSKTDFLANMSHEIRTPLNAIIGMAQVLSETKLDAEQARYVNTFRRAGMVLLHLINDILDLTKVEAGKLELEKATFDLRETIETSVELMAFRARAKGLELVSHVSDEVPQLVVGDGIRLRQVLLNLLSNAVKFTERGNVRLNVTVGRSPFSSGDGERQIEFTVSDTGIGIPPDQISRIFEKFNQAAPGIAARYGGTGLGLNICRRLVEMMNGTLWVESRVGEGSHFHFTLPLQLPVSDALPTRKSGIVLVHPLKILLADDSPDNRMLVEAFLKKLPYRLTFAENGAEALERFKSEPFDLVLIDMNMPVMDGHEAMRAMRAWEKENGRARTPAIALTAYALKEDYQKSSEAGCDLHVTKPIDKDKLLRSIREVVGDPHDIPIHVAPELRELVPNYFKHRQQDLDTLEKSFSTEDFNTISRIAHNLKGSSHSYGFDGLGEIGKELEVVAQRRDLAGVRGQIDRMRDYLDRIRIS